MIRPEPRTDFSRVSSSVPSSTRPYAHSRTCEGKTEGEKMEGQRKSVVNNVPSDMLYGCTILTKCVPGSDSLGFKFFETLVFDEMCARVRSIRFRVPSTPRICGVPRFETLVHSKCVPGFRVPSTPRTRGVPPLKRSRVTKCVPRSDPFGFGSGFVEPESRFGVSVRDSLIKSRHTAWRSTGTMGEPNGARRAF